MDEINKTVPPPTYQQHNGTEPLQNGANRTYYDPTSQEQSTSTNQNYNTGQMYYQPPPAQQEYIPPPSTEQFKPTMNQRFTQFYSPPENRKLGIIRKVVTLICCCILLGLIIGLATGLTKSYYTCNCRINADCIAFYGPNTFCYRGCQCAYL